MVEQQQQLMRRPSGAAAAGGRSTPSTDWLRWITSPPTRTNETTAGQTGCRRSRRVNAAAPEFMCSSFSLAKAWTTPHHFCVEINARKSSFCTPSHLGVDVAFALGSWNYWTRSTHSRRPFSWTTPYRSIEARRHRVTRDVSVYAWRAATSGPNHVITTRAPNAATVVSCPRRIC